MNLSEGQRSTLEKLVRRDRAAAAGRCRRRRRRCRQRGAQRAHRGSCGGVADDERAWRSRFAEEGLAKNGQVRTGRGPKPSITPSRWSRSCTTRCMPSREVKRIGVHGRWPNMRGEPVHGAAHLARSGLKPHLVDTFKVSTDPWFEEKLSDVVGFTGTRRRTRSCCAWMRSRRCRPWSDHSRRCR